MEPIKADSAPVDALPSLKLVAAPLPEARAAEAGVPLAEGGDDPGYLIPQDVAAPGMPNGARRVDKWTSKLTDGQLSELRHLHSDPFSDDEFNRGVRFIDSTSTNEADKYLKDFFVKSPDSPSPAVRIQRLWANGRQGAGHRLPRRGPLASAGGPETSSPLRISA
ncbi:hypothetical protein ACWC9R_13775 [Streptomyces sp. NPDC001219]